MKQYKISWMHQTDAGEWVLQEKLVFHNNKIEARKDFIRTNSITDRLFKVKEIVKRERVINSRKTKYRGIVT